MSSDALSIRPGRVAIYGGAFNPPHQSHVFAITYLLTRSDFDHVLVMPTSDHVFGKDMAPLQHRIEWLNTIIDELDWSDRVTVSDFEGTRPGPSRTFDTLESLSAAYPECDFSWVIGSDNLTESHRWHRFEDLVQRWSMVVFERVGHERALAERAHESWCVPGPCLPSISSTELRAALRGRSDPALLRWIPMSILKAVKREYRPMEETEPLVGPVAIYGMGRMGQTWAEVLRHAHIDVQPWNRSTSEHSKSAQPVTAAENCPLWLMTVTDDAIESVAETLAKQLSIGVRPIVLHCAGRLGTEVLQPLARKGCPVGTLHPLQAVLGNATDLLGAWMCVGGDADAVALARHLVALSGGRAFTLPTNDQATYHAAAVMAANFITTLGAAGIDLLHHGLGLDEDIARSVLNPLMAKTVEHLRNHKPLDALTGPFARRDVATIQAHVHAITQRAPQWLDTYRTLAWSTARAAQWSPPEMEQLKTVFGLDES